MPASADALHPFVLKLERHHLVTASAWLSRVVAVGFQLASVRVLTSALGLEQYAVFALLASLAGWYLLADFGVGVSLQNAISEARAMNRPYDALVGLIGASGLVLLGTGGIVLWLAAPAASSYLLEPFAFLSGTQRLRFFLGSGLIFLSGTVGALVYKVWYAEHRGYLANVMIALSAGLGFAAVTLIAGSNADDKLGWSIVGYLLPSAVLPLAALAARSGPLLWKTGSVGTSAALDLFGRAGRFWVFGLMSALVLQVDYLVISQTLPAQDIAVYNVATKVFGTLFFVFNAALLALWPVLAEALARRQFAEASRRLRRYLLGGLLMMALGSAALAVVMPELTRFLSPRHLVQVPLSLTLLLAVYYLLRVWTDTFAMALQSMSQLRTFWILVPLQAAISVGLQIVLAPRLGLNGVVLSLIASFLLTVVWGLPFALRRHMSCSSGPSHASA